MDSVGVGGNPWDRQPGESAKAFDAFGVYLNLGPTRSITKVAQTLNKSRTWLGTWSSKYKWVDRALAWDADVRKTELLETAEELKQSRKRRIQTAQTIHTLAVRELQRRTQLEGLTWAEIEERFLVEEKEGRKTVVSNDTSVERQKNSWVRGFRSLTFPALLNTIRTYQNELRIDYDDIPSRREKEVLTQAGTAERLQNHIDELINAGDDPAPFKELFGRWDEEAGINRDGDEDEDADE